MDNDNETMELVESSAEYAGKLYNGLERIVASLHEDRARETFSLFADATEGLDWLIQALNKLNAAGDKYGGFETGEISGFLAEMVESAQNKDYVLLADLIEYEILPQIEKWGNRLDNILGV